MLLILGDRLSFEFDALVLSLNELFKLKLADHISM